MEHSRDIHYLLYCLFMACFHYFVEKKLQIWEEENDDLIVYVK